MASATTIPSRTSCSNGLATDNSPHTFSPLPQHEVDQPPLQANETDNSPRPSDNSPKSNPLILVASELSEPLIKPNSLQADGTNINIPQPLEVADGIDDGNPRPSAPSSKPSNPLKVDGSEIHPQPSQAPSMPSVDHSNNTDWGCIFSTLIAMPAFLTFLVALYAYAASQERVSLNLASVPVSNFRVIDTKVASDWDMELEFNNPYDDIKIQFDDIVFTIFYRDNIELAVAKEEPFSVDAKDSKTLHFTISTSESGEGQPVVEPWVLQEIRKIYLRRRVLSFSIQLYLKKSYQAAGSKSLNLRALKLPRLEWHCWDVDLKFGPLDSELGPLDSERGPLDSELASLLGQYAKKCQIG